MASNMADDLRLTGLAQVLVILKPSESGPDTVSAAALRLTPFQRTARPRSPIASGEVLSLKKHFTRSKMSIDSAIAAATLESGVRSAGRGPMPVRFFPHLGVMLGTVDRAGLTALRAEPTVAAVQGSPLLMPIHPHRVAAAKLRAKRTWGLDRLRIPKLWSEGLSGEEILVGHMDTGVDGRHAALKRDAIHSFAEFDWMGFQTDSTEPHDTGDHGTHTAGTIAGRPIRGRAIGVAPKAKLASAVVVEGGNVVARVLGGMDWAVGEGVRILNMSLGFPGYVGDFLGLTRLLRARNILPVFAVGNEGPGTSRSPGNYPEALSVGAIDRNGRVAGFSSSKRFQRRRDPVVPDLVAPGVDVISAKPGGGYQTMDGTSMATPHVAGLAALLMEAKPTATAAQVERAIFESCDASGISPDRGNRGVPNGSRALDILLGRSRLSGRRKTKK